MKLHDFKVRPREGSVSLYDIMIDGKTIEGVYNVDITLNADMIPIVKMTLLAGAVDAELRNSAVETRTQDEDDRSFDPAKCAGFGYKGCETCDMYCPYR